jgi:hypothetical protein
MPEASDQTPVGSGFTEGELQFASFWVRRKLEIRRAVYVILIIVNAVFWGYAGWGFIDAYAISYPRESRIPQEIAANELIAKRLTSNRPQSVQVKNVDVFQSTDGRLDMVVAVHNPNPQLAAEFTYRFNVSGELTTSRSGFLLPGESTYLGEFGFAQSKPGGKTAVLTVDDLKWKRVDPAEVGGDYATWLERRNAFRITNVANTQDVEISGKKFFRTTFQFENPTAYGYWNVDLYVILKRSDAPVAANKITLQRVASGDKRTVTLDWFETLPSITDTEIIPVVNFLEPAAYLPASR